MKRLGSLAIILTGLLLASGCTRTVYMRVVTSAPPASPAKTLVVELDPSCTGAPGMPSPPVASADGFEVDDASGTKLEVPARFSWVPAYPGVTLKIVFPFRPAVVFEVVQNPFGGTWGPFNPGSALLHLPC